MYKQKIGTILGLCTFFAGTANADIFSFNVLLNTSSLNIPADAPYSLELQLQNGFLSSSQQDGGPFTNPSNTVTLSNFNFFGGSLIPLGTLDTSGNSIDFLQGGASGNIASSVFLQANVPLTVFDQGFTPGSQLGFKVTYTNNQSLGDLDDIFDFGILDNNYNEIPTLGGDLGYSFAQIDFDSDTPNIATFSSDPGTSSSNGNSYAIDAPAIGFDTVATPEPNMFWIVGLGLVAMSFRKRIWGSLRKALPGATLAAILMLAAISSHGLMAAPASASEFFTTVYHGQQVTYEIINGFAVSQGDIIIGEASIRTDREGRRTASLHRYQADSHTVNAAANLWPKVAGVATVPYTTIHGSQNMTDAITTFNGIFAGVAKWVPRTNQRAYVEIDFNNQSLNSCYASLGYGGGKQVLQGVAGGCNVASNMHEMGHVMGFAHEQSRANRNSFIAIDFNNIAPSSQSQYTQELSTTIDLGLYDYSSLMHYGPRGFTRNGNPEMESIPVGITFGDPPTFSNGDIDAMNRLYATAPSSVTVTSNPSGLQVMVDGISYTAPQTFNWALNSTHTFNVPSGPQTVGGFSYIFGRWNNDLNADLDPSRTITVSPGSGMFGSSAAVPAITAYQVNYIKLVQFTPVPVLDNSTSTISAAGTVSASPAPQTFPGLAGQFFVNRALTTLTATPAAGNSFYSFSGDNTTQTYGGATNPLTLPADQLPGTFDVRFASVPEVLITTNITNNNASGASVTADNNNTKALPAAFALPLDAGWGAGTTHSVTAASPVNPFFDSNTRYTFASWTDGFASATRSLVVPTSGVISVGVNYNTAYHVTASANASCAGSVDVSPLPPNDGFVASGTPLTITATPSAPFVFAGFGGQYTTVTSSNNPFSMSATGEVVASGNFNVINSPLTVVSISPASLPKGSASQSITVTGTGFVPSGDLFLGNYHSSTYVNATTITIPLAASDLATAGPFQVVVQNTAGTCSVAAFGPSFLVTP